MPTRCAYCGIIGRIQPHEVDAARQAELKALADKLAKAAAEPTT